MRDDSRCSTHSSLRMSDGADAIAGGTSGSPAAVAGVAGILGQQVLGDRGGRRSTSKTSEASSRKIPVMPVCDAIASMRDAIRSNVGPDVSERAKRSCSA